MFDNPNEELKKLENQLLAAEASNDDFESFYSDILKEFGPQAQPSTPRMSSSVKKPAAAPVKKNGRKKSKKKKKKGIKGLVITLCLEISGIVAIIFWWLLRIL